MKKISFLLSILLSYGVSNAVPSYYNFNGGPSCKNTIAGYESDDRYTKVAIQSVSLLYVKGFITAFNMVISEVAKKPSIIGHDVGDDFIIGFIKEYCMNNPNSDMEMVSIQLVSRLTK
ncbi:hypothetical protein JK207_16035 [Gluconobacter cerinus]|uniref:hypothetical protein n=1 Tax=Gluconobacter cerinus TaxID=38307 RepID=UPI001B8AD5E1|nr:hypothetical protein [Gluconobacter cerinus]MBS1023501.1 hypothetical protein [Gluconobacter cerinus]